ncbi:hypothetical protein LTR17_010632 [Elasticomyces elasticus]|nr:hypothetical protein LTR17_010632 [Elasticomyces elasticus]
MAQQVCKTWKAVVDSSPHIQEALFYRPNGQRDSKAQDADNAAYIGHLCRCDSCSWWEQTVRLNPLLIISTAFPLAGSAVEGLGNLLYNDLHPQASCHRMLLAKPTKELAIEFDIHALTMANTSSGYGWGVESWTSADGVTRASFKTGATFREAKEQYQKVVEELREGDFMPVNARWGLTHA